MVLWPCDAARASKWDPFEFGQSHGEGHDAAAGLAAWPCADVGRGIGSHNFTLSNGQAIGKAAGRVKAGSGAFADGCGRRGFARGGRAIPGRLAEPFKVRGVRPVQGWLA